MRHKKLVVVGGGAAGYFCAINAAMLNRQLEVIILEKSSKILSKVKVSGGGRCNVTHSCFSIAEMVKAYPRGGNFLKKAFKHFFTTDTIEWFAGQGVKLKAEEDGRMFPVSDDSQTIINCFRLAAEKYGVKLKLNHAVTALAYENGQWKLSTQGDIIIADYVCITTGGHAKAEAYGWLTGLGLNIIPPVPSLFTFNVPGDDIVNLMGLSVTSASVKIAGSNTVSNGPLLITHWGISGPSVLKQSALQAVYCRQLNYLFTALVCWNNAFAEHNTRQDFQELKANSKQKIKNECPLHLPARLWEFLLVRSEINPEHYWRDINNKGLNKLVKNCCTMELSVQGKTTYKEEFVTAGGVDLNDIDVNTMSSKKHSGLYFAGEILNIDGITGGYNFQNAWTTAYIAAKAIAGQYN